MKNGILIVNKPQGVTSRDVVNKICQIFKTKKVGHTGTLDPLATGVLVICLGSYTKLVSLLTSEEKEYEAVMSLGYLTDTLDVTGQILKKKKVQVSQEEILKAFQNFPSSYVQQVPKYSAVKVNGKKLYEYARENKEVSLPTREVYLKNLKVLHIEDNHVTFRVTVSKGTYIRSLIEDIASSFGEYATMESLKRLRQGSFLIEEALDLENITIDTSLKTVEDIFDYPKVVIDEETYRKVLNGNKIKLNSVFNRVFVVYLENVIAIYEKVDQEYKILFKV